MMLSFDIDSAYQHHAPFIGRMIERLTGSGAHVDDLLQETFIIAFKKQSSLTDAEGTRSWLYTIAANLCRRHRRSSRRFGLFQSRITNESPEIVQRPDQQLEQQQAATFVHTLLEELPFKQREVFVLYELEELDGEQISQTLDIPLGTVWTRLHHARTKFKELAHKRMARENIGT